MNESKTPTRDYELKHIDDETGEYVKSTTIEQLKYRFYLRFLKRHFRPSEEDQNRIHTLFLNAEFYLGNKSYEPAVELSRHWEVNDDLWKEVERREGTKEDYKDIYGSDWEKFWNSWLEYKEEKK